MSMRAKCNVNIIGAGARTRHSCRAMIGLFACNAQPERFSERITIGPSPCSINDGDYRGGFEPSDIDGPIQMLDANYKEFV